MGNRVCKIEKPYNLTSTGWKYTFYVRDASGNIMTTYTKTGSEIENNVLKLDEVMLYGSSRIGTREVNALLSDLTVPTTTFSRSLGLKRYEVSNHLGNVLVTFTDRKYQIQNTGVVTGYKTYIASAQDYYPFGMIMNERNWNTSGYRFGFNSKEKDNETYGTGNEYDYGFRIYNPRIGKFLSVDPLFKSYPWNSTYAFAENT
jgi:RHS repeat-associated protein